MSLPVYIRTVQHEIRVSRGVPTKESEKIPDLMTAGALLHDWERATDVLGPGFWLRYRLGPLLERNDLYRLDDRMLRLAVAQALVSGVLRVTITSRPAPMWSGATSQVVKEEKQATPEPARQSTAASMQMATPTTAAGAPPAWVRGDPKDFDDAVRRLQAAKQRISDHGYQPKYTDAELEAMRDKGRVDDRFIVYVCKGRKQDTDVVGYKRASGRTTAWTATFDQVEDADLDPKLICSKLGMPYDTPGAEYTMIIIDTSITIPGSQPGITFVPTFKKLVEVGKVEFVPEGISSRHIEDVMTTAYAQQYQKDFKAFKNTLVGTNTKTFDPAAAQVFAESRFATDEERSRFMARQHFANEIGTNDMFAGNGLTKINQDLQCMPPGKQHGALETLTLEKNPPTIGQKRACGGLREITFT